MASQTSSPIPREEKKAPSIAILIAISTIAPMSMNVYLPSLAGMVEAFGTSAARVQLTMSLYFAAVAVAQVFVGPLSDRFGRRPVVLGGMAIYVLGSLLCLLAPTIEILIAGRLVQAIGGCTGLAISRAIVRDLYGREEAASMIGYVTMGMAVGPMMGPVVGGFLDAGYGWQGGFYLMFFLGVAVLLAAWLNLYETKEEKSAGTGLKGLYLSYRDLAGVPLFWAFALTATFTSTVYFAYLGGTPYIAADRLGMSPQDMGIYFMIIAAGYIAGNGLSGRLSEEIGVLRMVLIGSALPTVAVLFLVLDACLGLTEPGALALFGPMFLVGLGNGICLPNAIAGAVSVRPDLAGAAAGFSGSLQIGFGALTSALVAWLVSDPMWPGELWPMALTMAVGVLATWAGCLAAWRLEARD